MIVIRTGEEFGRDFLLERTFFANRVFGLFRRCDDSWGRLSHEEDVDSVELERGPMDSRRSRSDDERRISTRHGSIDRNFSLDFSNELAA